MLKEADAGFVRFVEGKSWDAMVRQLSDFAEGKGYPTGASKGANKSKSGKPSDFVAFVRELQRTFPKKYQHHMTSDDALAKAIGAARKNSCAGP